MTQKIQLNRYIRPRACVGSQVGMDSQKGVTLVLELDYDRRMIGVQYAVCNHDNGQPSFDKQVGIKIAKQRPQIHVPMWQGPAKLTFTDLTDYVIAGLTLQPSVSYTDLKLITRMYAAA